MPVKDIKVDVKDAVLDAALAYELHQGKGEQWRLVFKKALNSLPVKTGRVYKFLVVMSTQSNEGMAGVSRTLAGF